MDKRVMTALSKCTIKNGELRSPGIETCDDIVRIGDVLRKAIQLGEVPLCKVIGAKIESGAGAAIEDYISKRSGINRSYAELYTVFDEVIFEKIDGLVPTGMEDKLQGRWGYVKTFGSEVTAQKGMFYVGKGMDCKPKCLIRDTEIIKHTAGGVSLTMIVAEDIREKDFAYMSALLRGTDFVPMGQYFNLTQYLAIRHYLTGDDCIKIMYKRDIDEGVLTSIIRNFANNYEKTANSL